MKLSLKKIFKGKTLFLSIVQAGDVKVTLLTDGTIGLDAERSGLDVKDRMFVRELLDMCENFGVDWKTGDWPRPAGLPSAVNGLAARAICAGAERGTVVVISGDNMRAVLYLDQNPRYVGSLTCGRDWAGRGETVEGSVFKGSLAGVRPATPGPWVEVMYTRSPLLVYGYGKDQSRTTAIYLPSVQSPENPPITMGTDVVGGSQEDCRVLYRMGPSMPDAHISVCYFPDEGIWCMPNRVLQKDHATSVFEAARALIHQPQEEGAA